MIKFGTDGIRGRVASELTPALAYQVGTLFGTQASLSPLAIASDPRMSSDLIKTSFIAGLLSVGIDCIILDKASTPLLSFYLSRHDEIKAAAMISASHNPYYDNGIKLMGSSGFKISSQLEDSLNQALEDNVQVVPKEIFGHISYAHDYLLQYIDYLKSCFKLDLKDTKWVVDCANGALSYLAEEIFSAFGAQFIYINNQPDGYNINRGCGSTDLAHLQEMVLLHQADGGLAFDGDGDRILFVNHLGEVVNGDHILYIFAKYFKALNQLPNDTVVTTVMCNLGLCKALEKEAIQLIQTSVGDKYVAQAMQDYQSNLGGEQSGHIIIGHHQYSGDGVIVALTMFSALSYFNKSLTALSQSLPIYPQVLKNIEVADKEAIVQDIRLCAYYQQLEKQYDDIRLLIRPSGTQPMVRVMAEAPSEALAKELVDNIIAFIEKELV